MSWAPRERPCPARRRRQDWQDAGAAAAALLARLLPIRPCRLLPLLSNPPPLQPPRYNQPRLSRHKDAARPQQPQQDGRARRARLKPCASLCACHASSPAEALWQRRCGDVPGGVQQLANTPFYNFNPQSATEDRTRTDLGATTAPCLPSSQPPPPPLRLLRPPPPRSLHTDGMGSAGRRGGTQTLSQLPWSYPGAPTDAWHGAARLGPRVQVPMSLVRFPLALSLHPITYFPPPPPDRTPSPPSPPTTFPFLSLHAGESSLAGAVGRQARQCMRKGLTSWRHSSRNLTAKVCTSDPAVLYD